MPDNDGINLGGIEVLSDFFFSVCVPEEYCLARKGKEVVEMNLKGLRAGREFALKATNKQ